MKHWIAFLLLLLNGPVLADTTANGSHVTNMSCSIYFSPNGGAQQVIVNELNHAAKTVRVAAYEITVASISGALINAHKRGVDVRVIVDERESKQTYSLAPVLAAAGIDTTYDPAVSIHHNKFIVIDGYTLLTGSYNYSAAAELRNAENMLDCHSTGAAAAYTSYWNQVRPRMVPVPPRASVERG